MPRAKTRMFRCRSAASGGRSGAGSSPSEMTTIAFARGKLAASVGNCPAAPAQAAPSADQGDRERDAGDRDEPELRDLDRGVDRDQRRSPAAERRAGTAAAYQRRNRKRDQDEGGQPQGRKLGVGEAELHGALRKSVAARA